MFQESSSWEEKGAWRTGERGTPQQRTEDGADLSIWELQTSGADNPKCGSNRAWGWGGWLRLFPRSPWPGTWGSSLLAPSLQFGNQTSSPRGEGG